MHRRLRPADFLVLDQDNSNFLCGIASDVTILSTDPTGLVSAETRKREKYAVPMQAHRYLGLQVIAISMDGDVGPGIAKMLDLWTKRFVQHKITIAELHGSPRDEIVCTLGLPLPAS